VDHEPRAHDKRQQDQLPGIALTFQAWRFNNEHASRAQAYTYLDQQCARYDQEPPAGWIDQALAPFFALPGDSTSSPEIEMGFTGSVEEMFDSLVNDIPAAPQISIGCVGAIPDDQAPTNMSPSPPMTQQDWIEEALAELPPEPLPRRGELGEIETETAATKPRKPKVVNPQTTLKAIQKELIFHWFNASVRRRQRGFTVAKTHQALSAHDQMTKSERTIRTYLQELYKDGRLKRWEQPHTLPDGQKITVHWYASLENPDPQYHAWLVIKKGK